MIECLLVVVSYRSADRLEGLLDSVAGSIGQLTWHCLVVNNDPSEADRLAQIAAGRPEVEVLDGGGNRGYAGGINVALAAAPESRWTVFLNPDLRLGRDALWAMALAAGLNHAVVPTILDESRAVHPSLRREPSVLGSLGDALLGYRWKDRPPALSETILPPADYTAARTVDWATGAAMLVPSAIVEQVGPWDEERFFLYSEETDYCRRLREAGCQIRFLPEAAVVHEGGGSGRSSALHALQQVNRLRYYGKWHGPIPAAVFAGVVLLGSLLRSHRPEGRAALKALTRSTARAELPGGRR